jgi:hypothetical protein
MASVNPPGKWLNSARFLIAEAYNPPFYPRFEYEPLKALAIARDLNANGIRYPSASYYVHFPTKTRLPIHPELGSRDPMRQTVELFHEAGLKVVAYVPINHPFMEVGSNSPDYSDWMKRSPDDQPMITEHYGFARYYEGCLNSPLRQEYLALIKEILESYPVDVMYFDGPYQGIGHAGQFCHCQHCQKAYQEARGKPIPLQDDSMRLEDEIGYRSWMLDGVILPFMREVRELIRRLRNVPVLYNNTELLTPHAWRYKVFTVLDGFMFEAAETPEQKLFNLKLGQSTGKAIWTYVGHHTLYNMEHLSNRTRTWYSHPIESQELRLDGAVAAAANAGMVYWSLSRFHYLPHSPLAYPSGQAVRDTFDFSARYSSLLQSLKDQPQCGILVSTQTVNWYRGRQFVDWAYENYYYGAFQLLKENSFDAEPFLDFQVTPERLAKYPLIFVPNAPCLSDSQCAMFTRYVEGGGILFATHLTSVTNEYGRLRADFGLAKLLGVELKSPEPVEKPELYLRVRDSEMLVPQDPQIVQFAAVSEVEVIAETYDRALGQVLGPAIVRHSYGKGQVFYSGSGLEAIYAETRMESIRTFLGTIFHPLLEKAQTYQVDFQAGLMPHFCASRDHLLLHLLSNTGNKWKKLRVREQFLPTENVHVKIRIPKHKTVKSVQLLRSRQNVQWKVERPWLAFILPKVLIHEAILVELTR